MGFSGEEVRARLEQANRVEAKASQSQAPAQRSCPRCQTAASDDAAFCMRCGAQLAPGAEDSPTRLDEQPQPPPSDSRDRPHRNGSLGYSGVRTCWLPSSCLRCRCSSSARAKYRTRHQPHQKNGRCQFHRRPRRSWPRNRQTANGARRSAKHNKRRKRPGVVDRCSVGVIRTASTLPRCVTMRSNDARNTATSGRTDSLR
jgi:hypothetical protein